MEDVGLSEKEHEAQKGIIQRLGEALKSAKLSSSSWLASFEGLDFVILESSGDKQVNNQRDLTTRVIYQSIITLLDYTLASLTSADINQWVHLRGNINLDCRKPKMELTN